MDFYLINLKQKDASTDKQARMHIIELHRTNDGVQIKQKNGNCKLNQVREFIVFSEDYKQEVYNLVGSSNIKACDYCLKQLP